MTRSLKVFALIAALSCAAPGWAGCTLPSPPSKVPDGANANEQDMITAMQTLKRYNVDVNNFVKCLEFEAAQNRLTRDEQVRQHNAAIDGLQKIADKFNEQVKAFKSKSG